jgi:hypothetical protein
MGDEAIQHSSHAVILSPKQAVKRRRKARHS